MIDGTAHRVDRRIGVVLFVGVLAVYVAVTHGSFYAYDAQAMFAVTKNIVDHGTLRVSGTAFQHAYHLDPPYSPYGIAVSVLGVPGYALSKAIGHAMFLASMLNPVLGALAVLMVYKAARALGWSRAHGLMAAVGFGLFTQLLQATVELFSEPGVTLCVAALVFGVLRWRQQDPMAPLWVGLAAAGALQFRSDSLLTVWIGLLALPLLVPWRRLLDRRALLLAGVPMAASVAFLVWYDELRYHHAFVTYGGAFTTPLGFGLHGLLLDPGRSVFIFDPLAVLGVVGIAVLLVTNRPVAVLLLLLTVPRLLFFAKWSTWTGAWSWGPRFLLPTMPVLLLAAGELLGVWDRRSVPGVATRIVAGALVGASAAVNLLSVRIPYQQWLGLLAWPPTLARLGRPAISPANQVLFYDRRWSTGPLWGDVTLLRRHMAQMGPELFAHGPRRAAVGIVLLGIAVVALATGALWCRPDGAALRWRRDQGSPLDGVGDPVPSAHTPRPARPVDQPRPVGAHP